MQNKYKDTTLGIVEAVFNKLGGTEGVEAFLRGNVEITVVKHTIDLTKAPKLPFDGAEVVKHKGEGIVEIELRSDDNLYINGKKIELFLSERQKGAKRIIGNELRQEIEDGKWILLNSNILDYIFDHSELFPEHWKKDEAGETRYIFFQGSVFRCPPNGNLFVRYFYWGVGSLDRDYGWLDGDWTRLKPSALLAS